MQAFYSPKSDVALKFIIGFGKKVKNSEKKLKHATFRYTLDVVQLLEVEEFNILG